MEEKVVFDVIVVGGGVMGSAAAYESSRRGARTVLVEQYDFLHQRGSSHGESRTTRATYPEPYYAPLVVESRALWARAEAEFGARVVFPSRHLDVAPAHSASLAALSASCHRNRIPFRVMDSAELRGFYSGRIVVPRDWAAIDSDCGGVIRPSKAVHMLQTLARHHSALLRDNSEVTDITPAEKEVYGGGGVTVTTAAGEKFHGKKCVVTTGAWSSKLLKKVAGMEIPVVPLETAVFYWRIKEEHVAEYSLDGGFPTFASCGDDFYVYGTPALEFPGLIKVAVHGGKDCDPDRRVWGPVDGRAMSGLRDWIRERFAGHVDADSGPVKTQYCMYSMTPDEDFVIDFVGPSRDIVVGGGFSGHGFKMAPAVGRVLVDLALDGRADGVELEKFSIKRFQNNPKGNVKNFGDQVNLFAKEHQHQHQQI